MEAFVLPPLLCFYFPVCLPSLSLVNNIASLSLMYFFPAWASGNKHVLFYQVISPLLLFTLLVGVKSRSVQRATFISRTNTGEHYVTRGEEKKLPLWCEITGQVMVGANTAALRAPVLEVSATMTQGADWLFVPAIKVLVCSGRFELAEGNKYRWISLNMFTWSVPYSMTH